MNTPGRYDLRICAGATFAQSFYWKIGTPAVPVDLTGVVGRMSVRESPGDLAPCIELTTANLRLEIPVPAEGMITMRLSDEETAALTFSRGQYKLELEFPDGVVRRLIEGIVLVSAEV